MIIKCTNCSGALMYDVVTGKMKCKYCGSTFDVNETDAEVLKENVIECNVYSCTTCGAELSVNGVETSTFCAYCGQPTIIFDRVSKMQKPEKIIPFSVTKEQAVASIKKKFNKGFFVPDEIKNFEVERLSGIYIPFWLYDVYYYDKQTLRGKSGKNYHTYYREADTNFTNVTVDASSNLIDDASQRLEPYEMHGLKDYENAYFSGFYADTYDQDSKELEYVAIDRCRELFNKEMIDSVNASNVTIEDSYAKNEVKKQLFTMLPAWFMTIRYEDKPYTMMVNGQTGKTVGAVPIVKRKVASVFAAAFAVLIPICIIICNILFEATYYDEDGEAFVKLLFGVIAVGAMAFMYATKSINALKLHIEHTSAREMESLAKDRQKGDEN